MATEFNDASIKALKAEAKPYTIRDSVVPGFTLRVRPSGTKSFIYTYTYRGKRNNITLGVYPDMSLARARGKAKEIADDLDHLRKKKGSPIGEDPASKNRVEREEERRLREKVRQERDKKGKTFGVACDEYLNGYAKKKKKSWEQDQYRIKRYLIPRLGDKPLKEITRRELVKLTDKIEKSAPAQANQLRHLLSIIFNVAIDRGLTDTSPASRLPRAKETARDRVLTPEEMGRIWNADKWYRNARDVLRLMMCTGARVGEVLTLKWADIDRELGTITFRNVKQGGDHTIPIINLAYEVLEERHERARSVFVFPGKERGNPLSYHGLKTQFRRNQPQIGVTGWRSHDIRRTVRIRLGDLRVDFFFAERIIGHSVGDKVSQVYDRAGYLPQMREAMDQWDEWLKKIISGQYQAPNVVDMKRRA